MNNKGFTLVELLAVMIILSAISLVAVGGITSSLEKREAKEKKEQEELVIGVAKIYFSLGKGDKTCVKINTLIDENYIEDEEKIDMLNKNYAIKLDGNKYVYGDYSC